MNTQKIFLGSLFAGGVLAFVRLAFTRAAPAKQIAKPSSYAAIDAYVEDQRRRLHIPGMSLAIVEGDQIVHLRGFGQARPGCEEPLPQTPFFIGSLTKSFTALAVMQLVEAGKIELDAPVQRYLPWFCVAFPRSRISPPRSRVKDLQASTETPALAPERSTGASVTVRHLLNQTSGLPALAGELILADFDNRPDATECQVRALSTLRLDHLPGEQCEYSNLNYNILGLIVEAASGESYADYIHAHIFSLLGMRHSYTVSTDAKQNGLAMGHRHWFSIPFPAPDLPVPLGSLPSGQLISCVEDMAHYLIAHLNGGCYADQHILSEAGIDQLHRGVKEYVAMGISGGFYGMGWFDIDLGQTKIYSHSGNVPDFSAFMALVPGQKKGIVMLLNADPYGLPPITGEFGLGVTALLAGQPPAPIRLDFIQWIMRLLPLIPILQVAGLTLTLRRVHRWRKDPEHRPTSRRMWVEHILPPLIPDLTLAAALVYLRYTGLLRFLRLFMPDLAWIARISGGFAGGWALLRTVLILRTLRKTS